MLRWQGSIQANPHPRQASADIPINPDQFTDVIPELPQSVWREKASKIGGALYCVYLSAYAVLVITSAWLPMLTPINHAPIFALCNFVMLAITGLLQQHLRRQLKKERDQGFLQFSADLEWIVDLPYKVVAYGTGSILVVVAWDLQEELDIPHLLLLRLVTLVQIVCAAALVGTYMWKVHEHNLTHCEPDAMHSLYSPLQPPESLRGIRYIDRGGLVEQQAALLHYQLDNLQHLNKELSRLQKRSLEHEQSQDGSTTPLVDLKDLLDTREQELRATAAERDILQDEIRVARSLIGGREHDLLIVRSENDKYVEENEGLRAELDEWSVRTAKFEVALEAERLRSLDLRRQYHELRESATIGT
ncbi:hypothetical protein KC19_6G019700 [Ceratodon purpureus]|uniref:Uncharacterized protein n=1 Tax=Ceratodon purpureus TaxID=3225 RepID=A0A8T0HCQ3_CERPU|nr:hypothetical protein KC19_6G019700 [Ceratodon purpureus]